MAKSTVRLLISCPDQRGIIAAVTGFVADHGGNILDADQHTDPDAGEFLMRVELEVPGFDLTERSFPPAWARLAKRFRMQWRAYWGSHTKRLAIMVSREGHCLNDLLWRWKTGELPVNVPFVAGNHTVLADDAGSFGVPFHHVPVTAETKPQAEVALLSLLEDHAVDLVVLARYMQILSPQFVKRYQERLINIHHSFLPAFAGSRPYHQAFVRGVKLIGATSHYVTDELDSGPIIAQSTMPVDHRDTVDDLVRKGRDLERVVLATAVRLHCMDKVLVCGNKTVVFD